MSQGMTIFLNGSSSSGKSSIARELQIVLDEAYLHTGLDAFLAMMPPRWWGHDADPDGYRLRSYTVDGGPRAEIIAGAGGRRLMTAARRAMADLARSNLNIIVDEVLLEREALLDYARAFADLPVFFVGVACPVAVANRREQARGDRVFGAAATQSALVHTFASYDFTIDTSLHSPRGCALAIKAALIHPPVPSVFAQLVPEARAALGIHS